MSRPLFNAGSLPRRPPFAALLICAIGMLFITATSAMAAVGGTLTPTANQDYLNRQIDGGPSTSKTFTVTSTGTTAGTDDLVIDQISLTGSDPSQFTILETSSSRCTPGKVLTPSAKTCTIALQFNPNSTGVKSVGLQVTTNGPTLTNTGTIVGTGRDLEVSPATLEFGSLPAGEESAPPRR